MGLICGSIQKGVSHTNLLISVYKIFKTMIITIYVVETRLIVILGDTDTCEYDSILYVYNVLRSSNLLNLSSI